MSTRCDRWVVDGSKLDNYGWLPGIYYALGKRIIEPFIFLEYKQFDNNTQVKANNIKTEEDLKKHILAHPEQCLIEYWHADGRTKATDRQIDEIEAYCGKTYFDWFRLQCVINLGYYKRQLIDPTYSPLKNEFNDRKAELKKVSLEPDIVHLGSVTRKNGRVKLWPLSWPRLHSWGWYLPEWFEIEPTEEYSRGYYGPTSKATKTEIEKAFKNFKKVWPGITNVTKLKTDLTGIKKDRWIGKAEWTCYLRLYWFMSCDLFPKEEPTLTPTWHFCGIDYNIHLDNNFYAWRAIASVCPGLGRTLRCLRNSPTLHCDTEPEMEYFSWLKKINDDERVEWGKKYDFKLKTGKDNAPKAHGNKGFKIYEFDRELKAYLARGTHLYAAPVSPFSAFKAITVPLGPVGAYITPLS